MEEAIPKLDKTILETIPIELLPAGYSVCESLIDVSRFEYYKPEYEIKFDLNFNTSFDLIFVENAASHTLGFLFDLTKLSNQSIQMHGDVASGKSLNLISLQKNN